MDCPCHSKKKYENCCKPYHDGLLPENALCLMRSRYSAYALKLADYIIRTTHPKNSAYSTNFDQWKKDILDFSTKTQFDNLTILDFTDGEKEAYVTFRAALTRASHDVSFTERSHFIKVQGMWLYLEML